MPDVNVVPHNRPVPDLSHGRRTVILSICCLSVLIVSMDNTIVNVALPSIGKSLGASLSNLQWTTDAYTLVLASLLLLSGSMADRFGRRRTFQTGLVLFTSGSLLCSVAPSVQWLIAFRTLQAIGGSMLNPAAMSILTNVFTEPKARARAIGVWGAVVGIALGFGPVIGGLLTETVGWRSIFWINIPIGVAALTLAAIYVPESKAARGRRVDPIGQVLIIVAIASLTYAIIEGAHRSWTSPVIVLAAALAVAALLGLISYEPRRTDPLLDLRFFASAPFSGASITAVCAFAGFAGFLFLNTLYLQDVRGFSALKAGAYTLPMALPTVIFAPVSGRLVATRGPRVPLTLAGTGFAAGGVMLTRLQPNSSLAYLFGAYMLVGVGFGFVNSPITNTAVSGMPRSQAGVAAGVASTSRQFGQTLGVAVAGAMVGSAAASTFTTATHAAWWVLAGCGVVIVLLGVASTTGWAGSTALRAAERISASTSPEPKPALVMSAVSPDGGTTTGRES